MSTQALSWVFDESETDGATRLVMIGIANHVDRRGDGWAYVDEVLRVARCSLNSYHRAVRAAVEMGELSVEVRQGGRLDMRGGHRPNLYVFPRMMAESCGTQPGEDTESCGTQPGEDRPTQPGEVGGTQPGEDTSTPLRNDPSMTRQGPIFAPPSFTELGVASSVEFFDDFWEAYPRRNGKRVGRALAAARWNPLTTAERAAVIVGAGHYGRAVAEGLTIAKDPARWLRDRCWVDWQEPAVADERAYVPKVTRYVD
jgi:hypothetical protein